MLALLYRVEIDLSSVIFQFFFDASLFLLRFMLVRYASVAVSPSTLR